jgi:hypothetical protein
MVSQERAQYFISPWIKPLIRQHDGYPVFHPRHVFPLHVATGFTVLSTCSRAA